MEFTYQKIQCARCKEFKYTLISIIFYTNQTEIKICFDCFAPLLIESDDETIEEVFAFMDEKND